MNNGNKQQVKRLPARRTRKYFQQNHKRKFTQTKERMPNNVDSELRSHLGVFFFDECEISFPISFDSFWLKVSFI